MNTLRLFSPAKLNLFLHILGRRPDGYHSIQTVFQFVDYCDELTFSLKNDGQITLTELPGIPLEKNLIWQAARLLQQTCGVSCGVEINLTKKIPMGAGLGGGSSNAAAALIALNTLWQCHLSLRELMDMGRQLGADIPVFISGQASWAEGIGDQLKPLDLPKAWYLIVIPKCHVSTAEIYNAPELTRNTQPITISEFLERGGHNDCELLVKDHYPEVRAAFDWLNSNAKAKLTGTGSALFASFASEEAAREVAAKAPCNLRVMVVKGLSISPCRIGV